MFAGLNIAHSRRADRTGREVVVRDPGILGRKLLGGGGVDAMTRPRLTPELWPPSRREFQHVAALEILTAYEPPRHFSYDVLVLLRGDTEDVTLEGDL